ncbi:TorF family putative porin [Aquirhabdus parva]|uniref:Transporter n=1 Tax=Aquirhabdus parva TaxID=2283318 RepID=A0A345P3H0_9GAMM|nr:TorF family putative porin [Aquirhabdus parva]AXI01829.1 hypothetical protein HYN46_02415 [Aquirhabdus parva]
MKVANVKSAALKALVSSMILVGGVSLVHAEDANPDTVLAGTPYEGTLTGNINVVSKYILRGITQTYGPKLADGSKGTDGPEMDSPALQGGLDYVLKNGLYVGYWFSTLGYSYADLNPDHTGKHSQNSTESDIYGGYTGTFGNSGIGYTVGGTVYVYTPGWASTGYETKLGLSYGEVSVTAQTLLNDVTFGNTGDTYYLATWTHALPKDFTFTGQVGLYTYGKKGDYINSTKADKPGFNPAYPDGNPDAKTFAFRHVTLGLSHPLPIKGGTWGLQYIVGGDNRFGVKQDNQIVGSLGLTF